jgi:hypothetical protein
MIYLLFHDRDTGAREEWNTFYTPCEVFTTEAARQARRDFLGEKYKDLGIDFHTLDLDITTNVTEPIDDYEEQLDWGGHNEDEDDETAMFDELLAGEDDEEEDEDES